MRDVTILLFSDVDIITYCDPDSQRSAVFKHARRKQRHLKQRRAVDLARVEGQLIGSLRTSTVDVGRMRLEPDWCHHFIVDNPWLLDRI